MMDEFRTPYQYQPIDEARYEIRLMTLHPGSFSSPIRVSLTNTPFSADSVPKFEALSYTWGSPIDPVRICVGDTPANELYVTQNLVEALPYLRCEDKPRVLWIDAICVNQQDLGERSRQVLRMADIFSKAGRVVVWLGPESEDSAIAIDYFTTIASHVEIDWMSQTMQPASKDATWADMSFDLPINEQQITAIVDFLLRPWFGRLWIWQEIRLASHESMVLCGRQTILWQYVRRAAYCLSFKMRDNRLAWSLYCLYSLCDQGGFISFNRLISVTSFAKVADPRDKIYALLSMRHESESDLDITPDYTKSLAEVLHETASRYVEFSGNLEFLTTVLMHEHLELPSWVPDWSTARTFELNHLGFASGLSRSQYLLRDKVLTVTGVTLSSIERTAGFNLNRGILNEQLAHQLTRIAQSMDFHRECVLGSHTLRMFCRTLVAGYLGIRFIPSQDGMPDIQFCEETLHEALHHNTGVIKNAPNLDRTRERSSFFSDVGANCAGAALFTTTEGRMGLAPRAACEGDVIVVLLGCSSPIVLRPTGSGQYIVVGEAYYDGYMDGEALLGPLGQDFYIASKFDEGTGKYWWTYFEQGTGNSTIDDPRLGELPPGWKKKNHGERHFWNWFVNSNSGEEIKGGDPRLSVEALLERGVKLREFELV